MSDKPIQIHLLPLTVYVVCGLIASIALHLLAFAGLLPDSETFIIGMSIAMMIASLPLWFGMTRISTGLFKDASGKRIWRVPFAPTWMRYTAKVVHAYSMLLLAAFLILIFLARGWIQSFSAFRFVLILWSAYLMSFFFVGLATLITVYRRGMESTSYELAGKDAQDSNVEGNKQFDPKFCGMVCRVAAIACLVLALCVPILLTTVDSSKCPGWVIPTRHGMPPSVWGLFAITAPWALVVSYYAVTWRRFAQRIIDRIEWGEQTFVTGTQPTWYGDWTQFNAMCARQINFNALCVAVMIFSVLFTAVPLLAMAINCF